MIREILKSIVMVGSTTASALLVTKVINKVWDSFEKKGEDSSDSSSDSSSAPSSFSDERRL